MPLNETDKAWVRQTIRDAIADTHKISKWGKLTRFIKEWSGTSAAVAVLILFFTQWTGYIEFRTHTNDRLDTIESNLRTLLATQSPRKVLSELVKLPVGQLAKNLPALRKVSEQSPSEVGASPQQLKDVALNLSSVDQTAEDYWITTLKFLQFASIQLAPKAPDRGSQPPITLSNIGLQGTTGINLSGHIVVLDGVRITDVTISNARIVFTRRPSVLQNVRFVDCAFEFPDDLNNDLPPYLKKTSHELLEAGISSATVNTGV